MLITIVSLIVTCGAAFVSAQEQKEGQKPDATQEKKPMNMSKNELFEGEVNAPDFPADIDWLNTDKPISMRDLRGKIVNDNHRLTATVGFLAAQDNASELGRL